MTERTCQAVLTDIAAYLDGELAATECLTIDAHCGACPSCAALVAGLGETVGLCRRAAAVPLPHDVRARALERVRKLLNPSCPGS